MRYLIQNVQHVEHVVCLFFLVLLMQQCNLTFAAKTHFLHIFKLKETCGLFLFIYFLPNNPSSEIKSKY